MKSRLVRPAIQKLQEYQPGEQPKIAGLIKLNTNENPYPPSPCVMRAIRGELGARLRLYPDPHSDRFRKKIAQVYGFHPNQVVAGNGSDDILTMCLRAFVGEGSLVQFPRPTYSLYPVLTQIQNGRVQEIPLNNDFGFSLAEVKPKAALTLIANPNAPTGTLFPNRMLALLAQNLKGVLVIDEAYADFASHNALALARKLPNVLVTRSFSKSFSLAGMRLGFAVGPVPLIEALGKVKDSYNLDRLAQLAGEAALSDMAHHKKCVKRIVGARERLRRELQDRGWKVVPSEANFLFVKPKEGKAKQWLALLRDKKILVRWFGAPETRAYLRITIGTEHEMRELLCKVDQIDLKMRGGNRRV